MRLVLGIGRRQRAEQERLARAVDPFEATLHEIRMQYLPHYRLLWTTPTDKVSASGRENKGE